MFIIAKSVLFFGTILLFGYVFVAFWLRERRILALIPLTILLGINSYVFFLNIFSYFFPIKIMIWLLPVLMGLTAIVFLLFFVEKPEKPIDSSDLNDLSKKQLKIIFFIATIIFILSGVAALRTLELDDTSLTHIPLAKTISEGNFPVADPSSPSHPLAYHYAPDLLAGAMHSFAGLPLWLAYDIQTAFFAAVTFLTAFLLAFSLFKKYRISIFASLLLFCSGGLSWLQAIDGIGPLWRKFILGQDIFAPFRFLSSMDIPQLNPNFMYSMGNHSAMGMPLMLLVIYLFF